MSFPSSKPFLEQAKLTIAIPRVSVACGLALYWTAD